MASQKPQDPLDVLQLMVNDVVRAALIHPSLPDILSYQSYTSSFKPAKHFVPLAKMAREM